MRKKEAPEQLPIRAPDDEVRPLAPVSTRSPESGRGPGPVAVGVGVTILSAGALMAALALPRSHATASEGEVRATSAAVRALAEEPAPPAAPDLILTRFPAAPVPTTVRVVPNPRPPKLGGAMMMPMDER